MKARATLFVLALVLVGCGSSGKKAKWEKGWEQVQALVEGFAALAEKDGKKDEVAGKLDKMKDMFISKCTSLSDELVDCVAEGLGASEECRKKLEAAGFNGGGGDED